MSYRRVYGRIEHIVNLPVLFNRSVQSASKKKKKKIKKNRKPKTYLNDIQYIDVLNASTPNCQIVNKNMKHEYISLILFRRNQTCQ
jgi:hypothetical protein